MPLSLEEQKRIAERYLRGRKRGYSEEDRALFEQAADTDPDFMGALRQEAARRTSRETEFQSPSPADVAQEQRLSNRGFLEGGPISYQNLPSLSGIADKALDYGLTRDALKVADVANTPNNLLLNSLASLTTGTPASAGANIGLATDMAERLAGRAEIAPRIKTEGLGEAAARVGAFIPGVGQATSALFETDAGGLESIAGAITRNLPMLAAPGLAAGAGRVPSVLEAAGPSVGIAAQGAEAFGGGGDIEDVIAATGGAALGLKVGQAIPTGSIGQVLAGEAAQLPIAGVQTFLQEPESVGRILTGEATQADRDLAVSTGIQALIGAGLGVTAGAYNVRQGNNLRLAEAGATPESFRSSREMADAGRRMLSELSPEERQARLEEALASASGRMGAETLRTNPQEQARAEAIARLQKRRATGDETAQLSESEYRTAVLRHLDGEQDLFRPDREIIPEGVSRKAGALSRVLFGGARDVDLATPEARTPSLSDPEYLRSQGNDPVMYAMGDDLVLEAARLRQQGGDEARIQELEQQGSALKEMAVRRMAPDSPAALEKDEFEALITDGDVDFPSLAAALGAENIARATDSLQAERGQSRPTDRVPEMDAEIAGTANEALRLTALREDMREKARVLSDEVLASARELAGLKGAKNSEATEALRARVDQSMRALYDLAETESLRLRSESMAFAPEGRPVRERMMGDEIDNQAGVASILLDRIEEKKAELRSLKKDLQRQRNNSFEGLEQRLSEARSRENAAAERVREFRERRKNEPRPMEQDKQKALEKENRTRIRQLRKERNQATAERKRLEAQAGRSVREGRAPDASRIEELTRSIEQKTAEISSSRADLEALAKDIEGYVSRETQTASASGKEITKNLTNLSKKLVDQFNERQRAEEGTRAYDSRRNIAGRMFEQLKDASPETRARVYDSARLAESVRAELLGMAPTEAAERKSGSIKQALDLNRQRLEAKGRERELKKQLKERKLASGAQALAREAKAAAESSPDVAESLNAAKAEVDAELSSLKQQIEDAQREQFILSERQALALEDASDLSVLDVEDPSYPVRREAVKQRLVEEGRFATAGQADEFIRTIEQVDARQEVQRVYRNLAVPNFEDPEIQKTLSILRGESPDPRTEDAAKDLFVQQYMAKEQDAIKSTINAALRGVPASAGFPARVADKLASGVSQVLTGFGNFGNRAAILEHEINRGGPEAVALRTATGLLRKTEETAFALRNAFRSATARVLDQSVTSAGERVRQNFRKQLTLPESKPVETEMVNAPEHGYLDFLRRGDHEGWAAALEKQDKKKTIKNYQKARSVLFIKAAKATLDAIRPAAQSVNVGVLENYFPQQLSADMLDRLRSPKGDQYARAIAEEAAKKAPEQEKDARYNQVYRALVGAFVDPAGSYGRSEDARAIRRMVGMDNPSPAQQDRNKLNRLAESEATQSRELDLPEFIYDAEGNAVPVLSRDFEGTLYHYTSGMGRVIAARSVLGYNPSDGKHQRLADVMAAIPQDSRGFDTLLSLFDEVALGRRTARAEGDIPFLGRIMNPFDQIETANSLGARMTRTAVNSIANIARPALISFSHPNQVLSFAQLIRDARGLNKALEIVPGFTRRKDRRLTRFLADMHKEGLLANAGMAKEIARAAEAGEDLPSSVQTYLQTVEGVASDFMQEIEALYGENQLSTESAVERGSRAVGNVIGQATFITPMNKFINNVATRMAVQGVGELVKTARDGKGQERLQARADLRDVFGITDPERAIRTGLTDEDFVTAARNMRARANAVDRSAFEQPLVMRHWLTRKMFSLASVAMIQASNMAIAVENMRESGALTRLVEGKTRNPLSSPIAKKAALYGFTLMLSGLYKESVRAFLDREDPTESPIADFALNTAAELGYVGGAPLDYSYEMKFGGNPASFAWRFLTGGAPVETQGLSTITEMYNVLQGDEELGNVVRAHIPIVRALREGLVEGRYEVRNVGKRIREYEKELKRIYRGEGALGLLGDADRALDVLEKGRRIRRLREIYESQDSGPSSTGPDAPSISEERTLTNERGQYAVPDV